MSELDRELDAALRAMTAAEGPPDLRRRVLARIGEQPRRALVAWPAMAAAVGIAIAVVAVARLRTSSPAPEPAGPSAGPPLFAPRAAATAAPPGLPIVARAKRAPSSRPPAARPPLDIEPGVGVEPIELAPLAAVVPIDGDRVAVNALTIERIEIEPLAEPQP